MKRLKYFTICLVVLSSFFLLASVTLVEAQLFSSPVSYQAGGNPHHVYSKDFNGDGHNDLVVCGYEAGIISILLNNGDGTFAPAVTYSAGSRPSIAIAEDLDGDGDFDLAIPNDYTNYISILMNDGNGAFNTRNTYTVGSYPYFLSVADFNNDGSKDIAVANEESNFASILLNKGDGTFYPSVNYQTGANVMSTFAGDFDGDGDKDLATSNMGSQTVTILLNNGDGTFVKKQNYSVGAGYFRVSGGNFDGDGDIDLVVTNDPQDRIDVLLNDGHADFTVTHQYPTGDRPFFLYCRDLNSDGYDDIATSNINTNTVSIFMSNGDGTFQGPEDYICCSRPHSVYAEDIDGDGDKDLLIADYLGNKVQILFSQTVDNSGPEIVELSYSFAKVDDLPGVELQGGADDRGKGNSNISGVEYFFDDDQGCGKGTRVAAMDRYWDSVVEAFEPIKFTLNSLSQGGHTLYLRAVDKNGNWGPAASLSVRVFSSGYDPMQDGFNFKNSGILGHCSGMAWASEFFWRNDLDIPDNDIQLTPADPMCPNTTATPPIHSLTRILIEAFQWGFVPEEALTRITIAGEWSRDRSQWIADQYYQTRELLEEGHDAIIYLGPPGVLGFGHAVLAYQTAELGDELRGIFVYDPNYPNRCQQGDQGILVRRIGGTWKPEFGEDVYDGYGQFGISNFWLYLANIDMLIAACPIDVEITTSLGDYITKDSASRQQFIYSVSPFFGNTSDSTHKVLFFGENYPDAWYRIKVIPHDTADAGSTFSLIFFHKGNVDVIADYEKISEVLDSGYTYSTLDTGSIYGSITANSKGFLGLEVDLYNEDGSINSVAISDDSGRYHFDGLANGSYAVAILAPLEYLADEETKEIDVKGLPHRVDFALTRLAVAPQQRSMGYWKHQVSVYLSGKGTAQEKLADISKYMNLIRTHFNNNLANPITIFQVPQPATQTDSLEALQNLLTVNKDGTMNDRAKQQLITLMLNVVSGKIHQATKISEDNASVSQALTYCNQLISDSDASNDEKAKDIAVNINNGLMVTSRLIPLGTPNISYKETDDAGFKSQALPKEFSLSHNYPNPFNPRTQIDYALPKDCNVKLTVFNILGQKVRTLEDGFQTAGFKTVQWDGKDEQGKNATSGIYFYRIQAGDFTQSKKMLLMK